MTGDDSNFAYPEKSCTILSFVVVYFKGQFWLKNLSNSYYSAAVFKLYVNFRTETMFNKISTS